MVSVTVRNTFVHVEGKDSGTQPLLSRSETEPLPQMGSWPSIGPCGGIPDDAQDEQDEDAQPGLVPRRISCSSIGSLGRIPEDAEDVQSDEDAPPGLVPRGSSCSSIGPCGQILEVAQDSPPGLENVWRQENTSPLPAYVMHRPQAQQACFDATSALPWRRQVTVRNTFVHIEGEDSDAQPALSRAETEPLPRSSSRRSAGSRGRIPEDAQDEQIAGDTPPGFEEPRRQDEPIPLPTLLASGPRIYQAWGDKSSALPCKAGRPKQEPPGQTTIMLRNLPNGYTRDDVLSLLVFFGFAGKIDFFYLPIDFETKVALGYAFINTLTQMDAELLWRCMDGFSSWRLPSSKVCHVSWSKPIQGLEAHVERYRNSPLMHEAVPDAFRPMLFNCRGERVPFPAPTKKIKAPRKGTKLMLTEGAPEVSLGPRGRC